MLVPMSKERFVERMLSDAERAREEEKEKQRRLRFEMEDYLAMIRFKITKRINLGRYYR